jgi:FixJ family two-component response regulator
VAIGEIMNSNGSLVYIVDDDASLCEELACLLKSHRYKIGTFTRSADFLAANHPNIPSCLLLDIRLPDIGGFALQDAMAVRNLVIPTIFITGHGDIPTSVKAMKGGAVDFLPKPFTDKMLLDAVSVAISKSRLLNKSRAEQGRIQRRIETLTSREKEVMSWVVKGMLNKQIATKLGTSLQTIKIHRGRVMQKMQARSVAELIKLVQKSGIAKTENV